MAEEPDPGSDDPAAAQPSGDESSSGSPSDGSGDDGPEGDSPSEEGTLAADDAESDDGTSPGPAGTDDAESDDGSGDRPDRGDDTRKDGSSDDERGDAGDAAGNDDGADEGLSDGDPDPGSAGDDGPEGAGSDDSPTYEELAAPDVGDPGELDDGASAPDPSVGGDPPGSTTDGGTVVDDDPILEGPEEDEGMPIADHIEEMMRRLGVVFLVGGTVTLVTFGFGVEPVIEYFWQTHIPEPDINRPRVYAPLEFVFTKLKVSALAGLIVALPVFVYETYLFMRPGLYPHERRYYLAAVPTSLVLGLVGSLFAHFIVLPALFSYFTAYTDGSATVAFGLQETFNLIVIMLGYLAIVFQIPLFIQLAIMMGLVTRKWLEDKRLIFWGSFLGVSFIASPDPTGMAPIMVTLTMIALYEGTLALLRWTQSSSPLPSVERVARQRPIAWGTAAAVGYALSEASAPSGYYDRLPEVLRGTLASAGLAEATPLVIGGGTILAFELLAYYNKNRYGSLRVWRAARRLRPAVWVVAGIVGYLGSPDPSLFRVVERVALEATVVAAVVVGLVLLFEVGVFVARRRGATTGAEPPE